MCIRNNIIPNVKASFIQDTCMKEGVKFVITWFIEYYIYLYIIKFINIVLLHYSSSIILTVKYGIGDDIAL